jgi:hypothetical protein
LILVVDIFRFQDEDAILGIALADTIDLAAFEIQDPFLPAIDRKSVV